MTSTAPESTSDLLITTDHTSNWQSAVPFGRGEVLLGEADYRLQGRGQRFAYREGEVMYRSWDNAVHLLTSLNYEHHYSRWQLLRLLPKLLRAMQRSASVSPAQNSIPEK